MKKTFLSSAIVSVLMVTSAMGMELDDIERRARELYNSNNSVYDNSVDYILSQWQGDIGVKNCENSSAFAELIEEYKSEIEYQRFSKSTQNEFIKIFDDAKKKYNPAGRGRAKLNNNKQTFIDFINQLRPYLTLSKAIADVQSKIELDKKRQSGESSIDIVESIGLLFEGGIEVADIDPKTSSNLLKISGGSSFAHGSQSLNDLPEDQRTPDMFLAIRSEFISACKRRKRDELIGEDKQWQPVYQLLDEVVEIAKKKIGEGTKYTEKNIQYISNNELSYGFFPKSDVIYIVGSEGIKSSTGNPPFDSQSSSEIKNEEQKVELPVDLLRDFTKDIQEAAEIEKKREDAIKAAEDAITNEQNKVTDENSAASALSDLKSKLGNNDDQVVEDTTSSSGTSPSLFARINALGGDVDALKTSAGDLKKALDEQETTPHEKIEADKSDSDSKDVEALTADQIVAQVKEHVKAFYELEKDILIAEQNQAKAKAEKDAKQLRTDWVAQFKPVVVSLRKRLGVKGEKAPESNPSDSLSELSLWQRFEALGTEGGYQTAIQDAFNDAETAQETLENALNKEETTNVGQLIELSTITNDNKLLIKQRDERLTALESALEKQEKVKAEADERAQKAEKLKLYKEEKTKAVQGLLNGQELADLQRVAETLSKLPVPTHSTEHSPSVDSSVLEPYEAFKAIEIRFQEFKTKLGELKTNFENLTELADASEKPADSFGPVVLTSGDLEQALVEAQRQLTYEEGTLSYNIAKAEYELFRDKQLNLNTRIVAKKRLKQLASEATSVQLDDYFHGEKSSTQKFQEQFRALGSTLESVADSVETEFSEEKEKLQEDFENSLYYRYILKKSEEKKSEEKEITTKSEEKTASKPKILLENLVFQPFGSPIGMQLSSEYLDSEDMIKDSNIQYLDDNQEDSKNEVSEVSLRHLFAVNLLVQRLQTISPTLGTGEKGDSSTTTGVPLSGANAEAFRKMQLALLSAKRAQKTAEQKIKNMEQDLEESRKTLEQLTIQNTKLRQEKEEAVLLLSQKTQERESDKNTGAEIQEYNLGLVNQLNISKKELEAANERVNSLTQLLETERTAFETEKNALIIPIGRSLSSIFDYLKGIINTPAAADIVADIDNQVKRFVDMLYGPGVSDSLKLKEDLVGLGKLKDTFQAYEKEAKDALTKIVLPKKDEVLVSGDTNEKFSAEWFANRYNELSKHIDQLSEASSSAKAKDFVKMNSDMQQITFELTQLAKQIKFEKAKKTGSDKHDAEIKKLKEENEKLQQQMLENFNKQKEELQKKIEEASAASGTKVDPAVVKMLNDITNQLEKLAESANQRLDAVIVFINENSKDGDFKSEKYITDFLNKANQLRNKLTEASTKIGLPDIFKKQTAMDEAQKEVDDLTGDKANLVKTYLTQRKNIKDEANRLKAMIAGTNLSALFESTNPSYTELSKQATDLNQEIDSQDKLEKPAESDGNLFDAFKVIETKIKTFEEAVFNAVKQVATDAQKTLNDKLDSLNTSIGKLDTGNKNNITTKEYAQEQVKSIKDDMAKAIDDAKKAADMKTVADSLAPDATFAQRIDALQKSIANTLETKAKTQVETELTTKANTPKQTIAEAKAILDELAKIKTYEEDAKALISEYDAINQGLTDATNVTKSSEKEAKVQQINELKAKADELKQKAETLQKKKTDDEKNTEEAAEQERLKREQEEKHKKAAEDLEKQKQEVQKIIDESTTASADVKDLKLNLSNEGTDNLDVQNPSQEDYLAKLTAAMKLISSDTEYVLKRLDEGQGKTKNLHALRAAVANQRMSFVGKKDSNENVNRFIAAYESFMDKSAQLITAASTTEKRPAEERKEEEKKEEEAPEAGEKKEGLPLESITFENLNSMENIKQVTDQLGEIDPKILKGKDETTFKGGKKTLSWKTAEKETYDAWTELLSSISSNHLDLRKSGLKSIRDISEENVLDRARAVLAKAGDLLVKDDFLKAREGEAKAMYEAFAAAAKVVLEMSKKGK